RRGRIGRRLYHTQKVRGPMAPEPPCERWCGCTVTTWRRLRAQPGARGVEVDHAREPRLARAPVDHLGVAIEEGERVVLAEEGRGRGPEGEPDAGEREAQAPPGAADAAPARRRGHGRSDRLGGRQGR